MATIKEGDWVRVTSIKEVGVVERFLKDGHVFVRIPSKTNWPFPKWETARVADLRKTRQPKPLASEQTFEEALL
jgi:hypothetical protein